MPTSLDLGFALGEVAIGALHPRSVFERLTKDHLDGVIFPSFCDEKAEVFASGQPIHDGDITGYLVLSREFAQRVAEISTASKHSVSYIYSVPEGDIDDFAAIKFSSGFFTNNPGKTTFSPVQSVSEGKATIIDVAVEYHSSTDLAIIKIESSDANEIKITTTKRWITTISPDGSSKIINEGDLVSMSGSRGEVYALPRSVSQSEIETLYTGLTEAYRQSEIKYGSQTAWERITDTPYFKDKSEDFKKIINSRPFVGFQKLLEYARSVSTLNIYTNVHKTDCVVRARLLASTLSFDKENLKIDVDEAGYGVGLLRDERMWIDAKDIDILRILFLGKECTSNEHYDSLVHEYEQRHGARYYSIFSAQPGAICVVRTLCMPFSKFLPDDFDIDKFSEQHGLDLKKAKTAFKRISGEREVYHGCRGIRLFAIRPDLARLWLKTVLNALARVNQEGGSIKVRFLLATLSLAEEAERFFQIMDDVIQQIFGSIADAPIEGVATMLETGGAYICLEDILTQRGESHRVVGGLIGSNDFTTACLNMNRGDAPRHLIPGYVENGIFATSPFNQVQVSVVGRAMHSALQRSTRLALETNQEMIWGLAGELTTDWRSVQWLAKHLAPAGLNYISTSPETIVPALFAAAASKRMGRHWLKAA